MLVLIIQASIFLQDNSSKPCFTTLTFCLLTPPPHTTAGSTSPYIPPGQALQDLLGFEASRENFTIFATLSGGRNQTA